jgi:hypothetical protein
MVDYKGDVNGEYSLPVIVSRPAPRSAPVGSSTSGFLAFSQSLPTIVTSSGSTVNMSPEVLANTRPTQQRQESCVVSSAHEKQKQDLWATQQLMSPPHTQKTGSQWENELARRILSLYASSTAKTDLHNSQQLLDFVGDRRSEQETKTVRNLFEKQTNSAATQPTTVLKVQTRDIERIEEEVEDEKEVIGEDSGDKIEAVRRSKTKKKKKKKKKNPVEDHAEAHPPTRIHSKGSRGIDGNVLEPEIIPSQRRSLNGVSANLNTEQRVAVVRELLQKVRASQRLVRTRDKYRVTNTIRSATGKEITVRGTPRVFPVWFVADKDALSNWTALPGIFVVFDRKSLS